MSNPLSLPSTNDTRQVCSDRRVAVRHDASPETACQAVAPSWGVVYAAWVRDLSASGIGLIVECLLEAGTWLTVELDNAGPGASLRLRARVIHAMEMPNEHWLHGCAFERELTDDELHAFVA